MTKTVMVTPEYYLTPVVDCWQKPLNPNITLAAGKLTSLLLDLSTDVIYLGPGDKLIVNGTEIAESLWQEVGRSLCLYGRTHAYDSTGGWRAADSTFCFIYVNSQGDTVLGFLEKRGQQATHLKAPLKFDWSRYGVRVPNAVNNDQGSEIEELKQQVKCLELQVLGRDENLRLKESWIDELKGQVNKLEDQVREKDNWAKELVGRLVGSGSGSGSAKQEHELEQLNHKMDQMLALLQNNSSNSSDWRCQYPLQPPAIEVDPLPIIESRCCDLMPDKFVVSSVSPLTSATVYRVQLRVSIEKLRVFVPVDESVDCLFPQEICVCVSDERFHNKGWRFVKARDHHTTTMVAFYEGEFEQISVHGNHVFIPYRPEATFHSSTHEFFVGVIRGVGLRFMFLY